MFIHDEMAKEWGDSGPLQADPSLVTHMAGWLAEWLARKRTEPSPLPLPPTILPANFPSYLSLGLQHQKQADFPTQKKTIPKQVTIRPT